jgi:hemolysin III
MDQRCDISTTINGAKAPIDTINGAKEPINTINIKKYKTGDFKPIWRGFLHHYSGLTLIPLGTYYLIKKAATIPYRRIAFLYMMGKIICYKLSAEFHIREYKTVEQEQRAQRLDHLGISLFTATSYSSFVLLIKGVDPFIRNLILCVIFSSTIIAMTIIYKKDFTKNTTRSFEHTIQSLTTVPWLLAYIAPLLNPMQKLLLFKSIALYVYGFLVYKFKWFDWYPHYFGYHEIFHLITILAGVCSFINIASLIA